MAAESSGDQRRLLGGLLRLADTPVRLAGPDEAAPGHDERTWTAPVCYAADGTRTATFGGPDGPVAGAGEVMQVEWGADGTCRLTVRPQA